MSEPSGSAATTPRAAVGVASVPGAPSGADVVAVATAALTSPGLVVLTGAAGSGRSSTLARIGAAFRGPVSAGGGLAMLQSVPAFALSRAVRVRLPVHDVALLAEAVRSRIRNGLLLLDDLQWADPVTIAAIPAIAAHCRIAVTLRLPHRLPPDLQRALHDAASAWLAVPPMTVDAASALARSVAPGAGAGDIAAVVARAGGVPLAVTALARGLGRGTGGDRGADAGTALAYTVASALADLTRPARTALAALGLLGHPAEATLLGDGVAELREAALVDVTDGVATAVSPYTTEVAAGLLEAGERRALHRRLADLVPAREAARHLAAAGADPEAYQVAVAAAAAATATGERAELLLLACGLPTHRPDPQVRLAAAEAALAAGRPGACLRVLADLDHPDAAVLRGEAHLQRAEPAPAAAAVAAVPDTSPADVLGARDRIRLLAALAEDPTAATSLLAAVIADHGEQPDHPGLRAAVAAVAAATRTPGWEYALAAAAASAGAGGQGLAARWSAWLLVETLAADGRLTEAITAADAAATACAADLSYSWQTRFLAAGLWCKALRGGTLDEVTRRAGDLTDRTLPAVARSYALAAASLAEADGGLLTAARTRLTNRLTNHAGAAGAVLDWVAAEAAWLDGQPDQVTARTTAGAPLIDGLRRITGRWAALDTDRTPPADADTDTGLEPVRRTLAAWSTPTQFPDAAAAWHDLARREEIRCLLAAGLLATDQDSAVPPLLRAEQLAEEAGFVVLLGRARRALRRHAVRRDTRGRRAGDDLTDREREILHLVAQGEPTRRIAGRLGISRETVETHIRSGMRKLGARTRTEAAALAIEAIH